MVSFFMYFCHLSIIKSICALSQPRLRNNSVTLFCPVKKICGAQNLIESDKSYFCKVAFTPRHITSRKMFVYLLKFLFVIKWPSLVRITPRQFLCMSLSTYMCFVYM